jgi:hypothetical protein
MTKKEREENKKEFQKRMAGKKVVVSNGKWTVPIETYIKQEKHSRKIKQPDLTVNKPNYPIDIIDYGILSIDSVFETDLWYLRNHSNFDLSVRNGRRVRR